MSFINKIRTLAGESVIYGLSGIISKLISFFLLPFFARTLSTADYGAIALLQSFFFLFNVISILGLEGAVFRWYYDSEDNAYRKKLFSTTITFQVLWTVVVGAIMWLIGIFFLDYNLSAYPYQLLLGLLCINLLSSFMPTMFNVWCRLQHKPWSAISIGLVTTVVSFAASFLFVIGLKLGVVGFIGGQTVALALTTIITFVKMRGWINPSVFDLKLLKSLVTYGIKVVPASFATVSLLFLITIILQNMTSQSELGLYQMGVNFALMITLVTNAFAQAWSPFSFSILKEPEHGEIYNLTFQLYVWFICTGALFLALFSKELLLIIASEKFVDSALVAGCVTFAYSINSITAISVTGMAIQKDMKWYSPIMIISCGVTLILMILLIPGFGKEGAALAFLLGYLISPVLLFHQAQKIYPIPFRFSRPVIMIVISFAVFALTYFFTKDTPLLSAILYKTGILVIFILFAILLYYQYFKKFAKVVLARRFLAKPAI